MDTIIKEILSLDQDAKRAVSDAKIKLENEKRAVAAGRDDITMEYLAKAQHKIDEIRTQEEQAVSGQIRQMELTFERDCSELERQFKDGYDKWKQQIFDSCTAP